MPRFKSSSATDSSCSWDRDADEEEEEDEDEEEEEEDEEEEEEAAEEDGDELGGDEEDETTVGVDTFIEEATAFVENEENIGLPTIVALFTSLPLTSFATCLLSS